MDMIKQAVAMTVCVLLMVLYTSIVYAHGKVSLEQDSSFEGHREQGASKHLSASKRFIIPRQPLTLFYGFFI